MNAITNAVKAFVNDENGVTAIEYGLIAALIAAAIATVVGLLGGRVEGVFTSVKNAMPAAATP